MEFTSPNPTVFATYKKGKLIYEDGTTTGQKKLIDENDEEMAFFKILIEAESNRDVYYLNPAYNEFGQPDSAFFNYDINKFHVFNEEKNAYIIESIYTEGMENNYEKNNNMFNNMSVVYAYTSLKIYHKNNVNYNINTTPIFNVNCD